MTGSQIEKCRVCGNQNLIPVCDLGTMAFTGVFPKKDEQGVPEGPLELVKCHSDRNGACGLVQLRHSFDPRILFGESYGYRSGLNGSMRQHLQALAWKIRSFASLEAEDIILDIGSNDGTLLSFFSGEDLILFGVDPTASQFRRYYPEDARVIPALFSSSLIKKDLGAKKAKVITAIAVFYDFPAPVEFLKEAKEILSDDGICVLEQSYLPSVLDNCAYDMVCHEHAAYYRLKQIKWLADQAGLKIISCELNQVNGGSLCVVLAQKCSAFSEDSDTVKRLINQEEGMLLDALSPYATFRENILKHRQALCRAIDSLRAEGRRIFGYGASTKGNVLLQFCGLSPQEVPFVADINEDKWGRVCPGTRIPIISEEEAISKKPDVFFVLPWHFKESFLAKEERYLRQGGMFLFPLPRVDIIKKQGCKT
ncbi:MAG: class I SAM-dependent methyltransferase [Candidatus Omnitrophota bacterium]